MASQSTRWNAAILIAFALFCMSMGGQVKAQSWPAAAPYMRGYEPANAPSYAPALSPSNAPDSPPLGSPMSAPVLASPAYAPSSGPSSSPGHRLAPEPMSGN